MDTVENNQVEIELLKEEAEELGIKVHPSSKAETIQAKIEAKKAEILEKQEAKKKAKIDKENSKLKIIVTPRDSGDNIPDQFFGFNGESILIQFDEEVEVSSVMYEHIKSIGSYIHNAKTVGDKKEWTRKWQSRFLVEKVD